MAEYVHSSECQSAMDAANARRAAWAAQWPAHCTTCEGHGYFVEQYDPSPAGVGLASGTMTDVVVCEACVEAGRCGRCGADGTLSDDDVVACRSCGWTSADAMPPAPECFCWIEREREVEREAREYFARLDAEEGEAPTSEFE